jgi:Xaa-Pro aminopeptidase
MSSETLVADEGERAAFLLDAQSKAIALFHAIENTIIRPGIGEEAMSDEIHELALARYGLTAHWHKRVIRSGPNTLMPYSENPPDRIVQADDILFVDLGPVFEVWEADFGRTFVLGNDPYKHRIRDALEPIFAKVKARFKAEPGMTGGQLYALVCDVSRAAGWEFGGRIAGHLVGSFPHENIPGDKVSLYITEGNMEPMSNLDTNGRRRHWILEIHLVDRPRQIGSFYEELLTIG